MDKFLKVGRTLCLNLNNVIAIQHQTHIKTIEISTCSISTTYDGSSNIYVNPYKIYIKEENMQEEYSNLTRFLHKNDDNTLSKK